MRTNPDQYRFLTMQEFADVGVARARAFLLENPSLEDWVLSLFEVVRSDTFLIDGEAPKTPEHRAAGLWFTPVAEYAHAEIVDAFVEEGAYVDVKEKIAGRRWL